MIKKLFEGPGLQKTKWEGLQILSQNEQYAPVFKSGLGVSIKVAMEAPKLVKNLAHGRPKLPQHTPMESKSVPRGCICLQK